MATKQIKPSTKKAAVVEDDEDEEEAPAPVKKGSAAAKAVPAKKAAPIVADDDDDEEDDEEEAPKGKFKKVEKVAKVKKEKAPDSKAVAEFKARLKTDLKEDKPLFKLAKELGVTWNKKEDARINRMLCVMACTKAINEAGAAKKSKK